MIQAREYDYKYYFEGTGKLEHIKLKNQDLSGFEPQTTRFPGEDSTTEPHSFTW